MPKLKQINHSIIALLVIIHQLLSTLWYSPFLFGNRWVNVSGFDYSLYPSADSIAFYWPFIFSIITSVLICYAFAFLYTRFKIHSIWKGIKWAFVICFVFLFLPMLMHNQFAQRPLMLTLIDGGRDVILFVVTGIVISLYAKRKFYE